MDIAVVIAIQGHFQEDLFTLARNPKDGDESERVTRKPRWDCLMSSASFSTANLVIDSLDLISREVNTSKNLSSLNSKKRRYREFVIPIIQTRRGAVVCIKLSSHGPGAVLRARNKIIIEAVSHSAPTKFFYIYYTDRQRDI